MGSQPKGKLGKKKRRMGGEVKERQRAAGNEQWLEKKKRRGKDGPLLGLFFILLCTWYPEQPSFGQEKG